MLPMKKLLLFGSFLSLISSSIFAQPVITQNPQNAAVCVDSCANFSVSAVGNGLAYEWMRQDSVGNISAVGSMQTLQLCDSILQYHGSSFYCVVVDQNGDSVVSSMASLTVDSCLAPVADFYWDWSVNEICFTSTSLRAETLFWLFGDGVTNSNNLSALCHSYSVDELYFVKLIAYNAYGQDEIQKGFRPLSVNEVSNSFSLYPNPVKDNLTIRSNSIIESVKIYNVQGALVRILTPNSMAINLAMDELDSGIYSLVISSEGKLAQHRIVKQ